MGPMELVLILVLALIVFGPGKLPEIAGQVGKMVRDFRRTGAEMTSEFNRAFTLELEEKERAAAGEARPAGEGTTATSPSNTILPPSQAQASGEAASDAASGRRMRSDDLLPPY